MTMATTLLLNVGDGSRLGDMLLAGFVTTVQTFYNTVVQATM